MTGFDRIVIRLSFFLLLVSSWATVRGEESRSFSQLVSFSWSSGTEIPFEPILGTSIFEEERTQELELTRSNEIHHPGLSSPVDSALISLTQYLAPQDPISDPYYPQSEYGYENGEFGYSPGWIPEYLAIFHGLDVSKQPQDFGANTLFGGRLSADAGWVLDEMSGLGLQLGTSINYSDNGQKNFEQLIGSERRIQNFSTFALYQRSDPGFHWSLGFDLLYQDYYDNFFLGQWRGMGGFSVTSADDLGVWVAIPQISDRGYFGSTEVKLKPIQQVNFYWRHIWMTSVVMTNWVGWAQEHGQANILTGDSNRVGPRFIYGTEIHAPLNDHLAFFGQGNFIRPVDTGTIDAFFGIVYYFGGGAAMAPFQRSTPVLPLANNPIFANDLIR